MVKLLGISGSRVKNGNVSAALEEIFSSVADKPDVNANTILLDSLQINACNHCNWCLRKQTEDKYCVQEDDMATIYPRLLEADGILLASPAHFGRLSGLMADMIDRTRALVHGRTYKFPLKNKVGGAIAAAYFRGGGIETTLASLNLMFYVHRMVIATSGMVQLGAGIYTSREGKGDFEKEPRHLALEDEYGMTSAGMLVERMVELARILKAGQTVLDQK